MSCRRDQESSQELIVEFWAGWLIVCPTRQRGRFGDPFNSFIPKTAVLSLNAGAA
jgi:hypothetical protein